MTYTIMTGIGRIEAKNAERVLEEDFPELELIVHSKLLNADKRRFSTKSWQVSEAKTGLQIGFDWASREIAVNKARERIKAAGISTIIAQIEAALGQQN